jgi:putative ABC transport system permease protein
MLGHYLLVALRNFRRQPVAALIRLLVLSLGLTSFLVAYAVVSYWNHAEGGFQKADRTYVITERIQLSNGHDSGAQPRYPSSDIGRLKLAFPEFETIARASEAGESPVVARAQKMDLHAAYADPEFLDVFNLPFVAGDARDALRRPDSVILTRDAALSLFGTVDAVGRTLRYDGLVDLTVTGVIGTSPYPSHIGSAATSLLRFDMLVSWNVKQTVDAALAAAGSPPNAYSLAYAVLPKGSRETPQSLAPRFAPLGEIPYEKDLVTMTYSMLPVRALMVSELNNMLFSGTDIGLSASGLLFILGAMVLIVACLNYANLATAQALGRAKEVGLRKTIGAGSRQIALQYLIEAALLGIAAFGLAILATALAAPIIRQASDIDVAFALSSGGFGFWGSVLAVLFLTILLSGAYPAFGLARIRPVRALQASAGARRKILPAFLVGIQFAVASFLLTAIIVMQQQTLDLRRTGLAAADDPLVIVRNPRAFTGVDTATFEAELRRLPQVTAVTAMGTPPWSNTTAGTVSMQVTPSDPASLRDAVTNAVDYDFFSTMHIRLLAGRVFERDRATVNPFNAPDKATAGDLVIDEAYAQAIGARTPQAAIGKIIYLPIADYLQPIRIIGVVKNRPLFFARQGMHASVYYLTGRPTTIALRLDRNDVPGGLAALRGVWEKLAPGHVLDYAFEDQLFAEGYALFGHVAQAFATLATLAILICIAGLVGMARHMTGRRRHEIGVRKTLGASTGSVLRLLLKDFSAPVVIANIAAGPLAYLAASAYLDIFIHRIALTPWPFLLSLAVTLLIAWASVGLQSWRAARVKPAKVLRYE